MIHCYSLDLRVRIIAFVEAGHSCRAAARHFGVSDSCAIKLLQRQSQSGSPAPARQGRPPGTGKLAPSAAFLIRTVEAQPDITMPELAALLMSKHGVRVDPATLSRLLCRQGFTDQKQLIVARHFKPGGHRIVIGQGRQREPLTRYREGSAPKSNDAM